MNLYQERILDYYKNPRNRGVVTAADFASGRVNPSCGDAVSIQGTMKEDLIELCRFEAQGCVISQATAAMLCELAIGKPISFIQRLDANYMKSLIGMELGPNRLKCALLSLEALKRGLHEYQS